MAICRDETDCEFDVALRELFATKPPVQAPAVLVVAEEPGDRAQPLAIVAQAGLSAVVATSADEALASCSDAVPSTILLRLAGASGAALTSLRRLRAEPRFDQSWILAWPATPGRASRLAALEAGADDVVAEPLDLEEWALRLRSAHRCRSTTASFRQRAASLSASLAASGGCDRPRLMEAAAELSARHEDAQRIAHLGHWNWDISSGALSWSDECYRIFGLDRRDGEMTYERFLGHLPPEDRAAVERGVARALRGEERYLLEHRAIRADGTVRIVRESADLVLDAGGRQLRMFGTCLDVTESRQREAELRRSRELIRTAIETSEIVLLTLDGDGSVTALEGRSLEQVGISAAAMIGRRPWDALPSLAAFRDVVARALGSEQVRAEAQLEETILEISAGPLTDGSGRVDGVVLLLVDVTERRRAEARLASAERIDALGALSGGVAHDFNNLLAVLVCSISLAKEALPDGAAAAADLDHALAAANRGEALTQQLITLARRQLVHPVSVDVNGAITAIARLTRALLDEGIELRVTLAPELPPALIDPVQLDQVALHLVHNASEACGSAGILTISTGLATLDAGNALDLPPGRYVELAVTDTGRGLDARSLARLFEPAFPTRRRGAGLGLPLVYGILRQAGGTIAATSEPGVGSKLRCFLPVAARDARPLPPPAPLPTPTPARRGAILIVEDDPMLRDLVHRILIRAGHSAVTAADGVVALELLAASPERFSLVLSDVVMPRLGGAQLARSALELGCTMPFLFMTGYAEDAATRFGVARGVDVVIQKPFTPAALLSLVEERLAAAAGR